MLDESKDLYEPYRLRVTARVQAIKDSLAEDTVEEALSKDSAPKLVGRIGALCQIVEALGESGPPRSAA